MALTTHSLMRAAELARVVYDYLPDWVVKQEDGITYVAIEGSDSLVDWRRNFEFVFTSNDTHAGFANYGTLLMAQMLASGVSFSRNEQLVISGHSLGGAVATIMAHHLQKSHPRVDLVPHLPSNVFGFRHTGPAKVLPVPDDSPLRGLKDHDMDAYLQALEEHLNG